MGYKRQAAVQAPGFVNGDQCERKLPNFPTSLFWTPPNLIWCASITITIFGWMGATPSTTGLKISRVLRGAIVNLGRTMTLEMSSTDGLTGKSFPGLAFASMIQDRS